jgi:preprotein translocase subunit YajC
MLSTLAFWSICLAQAATTTTPAGSPGAPSSPINSLLQSPLVPLVCFVVIFYFLLIRPQQKRAKAQQLLISSVKAGDRVLTASGIYGFVTNTDEKTVTIRIAEGVKVDMDRSAIASIISRKDEGDTSSNS